MFTLYKTSFKKDLSQLILWWLWWLWSSKFKLQLTQIECWTVLLYVQENEKRFPYPNPHSAGQCFNVWMNLFKARFIYLASSVSVNLSGHAKKMGSFIHQQVWMSESFSSWLTFSGSSLCFREIRFTFEYLRSHPRFNHFACCISTLDSVNLFSDECHLMLFHSKGQWILSVIIAFSSAHILHVRDWFSHNYNFVLKSSLSVFSSADCESVIHFSHDWILIIFYPVTL